MSTKSNPVVWFEIPVKNIARAKKFYEEALEVALGPAMEFGGNKLSFFPMERSAGGAGGALLQCERVEPSHHGTTVYFRVEAIDRTLDRVNTAGGKTIVPRTSIGEYGFMAHFEDIEGNRVGLHEAPSA